MNCNLKVKTCELYACIFSRLNLIVPACTMDGFRPKDNTCLSLNDQDVMLNSAATLFLISL